MRNYINKFYYLIDKQNHRCAISGELLQSSNGIDLHHLCHNTSWRRKKFPLFLNSLLNLRAVDHLQHLSNGSALKISDMKAEQYEDFLKRHPKISEWVNNPKENL